MPSYNPSSAEGNGVLILSSCEKTRDSLPALLGQSWAIHKANDEGEAARLLERFPISVIIADGSWREILELATTRPCPPSVIVTAPFADEALWAEVLNLGGYDVLAQPFDANEVVRITQAAFRRAKVVGQHAPAPALALGLG